MKLKFTTSVVSLCLLHQPLSAFLQTHSVTTTSSHAQKRLRTLSDSFCPSFRVYSSSILQAAAGSDVETSDKTSSKQEDLPQAAAPKKHKHTLAILTMPQSASARIANE